MIEQLKKLMPVAKKIIGRGSSLPILNNILISGGFARVTNLGETALIPVDSPLEFAIPFKTLKKILDTKPEAVEFVVEGERVLVEYSGHVVDFPTRSVDEFPLFPEGEFSSLGNWSPELLAELALQSTYCSKDELKPSLLGVNVILNDGAVKSVVTDGHVLRQCTEQPVNYTGEFQGIIPADAFKLFSKADLKGMDVFSSEKYVAFDTANDVRVIARIIDEAFPDTDSVFPSDHKGMFELMRDELLTVANAGIAFANPTTKQGKIDVKGGKCTLIAEDIEQDSNWQSDLETTEQKGDPILFGLNLTYLIKVLKDSVGDVVRVKYNSPTTAFVLNSEGNATTLLMPIRMND